MTITEALAELKTNSKKIQKKAEVVLAYLWRPDSLKDPLEKQGGSLQFVREEMQSINDLLERNVMIRSAIARVNAKTNITIAGHERTIEEWLVWRRDISPIQLNLSNRIRSALNNAHNYVHKVPTAGNTIAVDRPAEVIINLNEAEFARSAENLEEILGQLDGQLSLKNATIQLAF